MRSLRRSSALELVLVVEPRRLLHLHPLAVSLCLISRARGAGTPLLVMILSVATCMSATVAFIAAVADNVHFASLETWTLLSGLGAASTAALTHTLYFNIRPSQW